MKAPLAVCAAAFCAFASVSTAHAQTAAIDSNTGFQTHLGPTLLIPTDGGPMGGGLEFGLRYGIKAGPLVIGPGGRAAGYFISRRFVGDVMPTLRVTVPLGPLAPFIEGGVGPGGMSNPGEAGVALLAGGGLMIHFGRVFGIGARASYETITSTEFKVLSIGPMLQFGF